MTTRPSEPLLAFLRETIRKKKLNTADLAQRSGIERARLKRRLSGEEDLTVDDLLALYKVLELTPADLGVPSGQAPIDEPVESEEPPAGADPYGNLPRQVFEQAVTLGIDVFLFLDTRQLKESGIPPGVLKQHPESIGLRMEARWFPQHKFQFLDTALVTMLLFDQFYECTLPWTAFRAIRFDLPKEEPVPAEPPPRPGAPFLRVVK